jgi:hypothetical protein
LNDLRVFVVWRKPNDKRLVRRSEIDSLPYPQGEGHSSRGDGVPFV